MPLDSEQQERLGKVYYKMMHELPYELEANELIAEAIRSYVSEHPDELAEFEEIVLPFEPQFHPSWYDPNGSTDY